MDIMSTIDRYVEISVRVQKLQEKIESENRGVNYAQLDYRANQQIKSKSPKNKK